jgi:diacylglycerol kinase (ATP)
MPVAVIINPIAGRRLTSDQVRARVDLATRVIRARGQEPVIEVTSAAGQGTVLARAAAAAGATLVIAWGGDGTVNEVAAGVARGPAALGIVPAGSGNGLARELGISHRAERALAAALDAPERVIDAGELGGRLFVNVAGVGFDAWIARRFDARGPDARRGFLIYTGLVLRESLTYVPHRYRVTTGGATVRADNTYFLTLANSPQFGNGARVAPAARIDDGRLDLVVFGARSRIAALWRARRLMTGGLHEGNGISIRPVEEIAIDYDRPLWFHVDGEPVQGAHRLTGRVLPKAIRIRA